MEKPLAALQHAQSVSDANKRHVSDDVTNTGKQGKQF